MWREKLNKCDEKLWISRKNLGFQKSGSSKADKELGSCSEKLVNYATCLNRVEGLSDQFPHGVRKRDFPPAAWRWRRFSSCWGKRKLCNGQSLPMSEREERTGR